MKFISLTALDFCLFREATLDLDRQGLVWIGGVNNDSDAASSNGAGKSTMFKAFGWGVYGKTIDGHDGDEVIRAGATNAVVNVRLVADDGVGWRIVRSRKKGSPKVELIRDADGERWTGDRAAVQQKIDAMVGMDWNTFRNTVLFGQGDRKRFADPMSTDAERKALLSTMLKTDVLTACHEWTKQEAARLARETDSIAAKIATIRGKMEEYDLEALTALLDGWADRQKERVKSLTNDALEALEQAKECESKAADAVRLQAELDAQPAIDLDKAADARKAAQRRARELEGAYDIAVRAIMEPRMKAQELEDKLALVSGDKCPTCTAPLDVGGIPGRYVSDLKTELRVAQQTSEAASKARDEAKRLWKEAERAADRAEADEDRQRAQEKVRARKQAEIAELRSEGERKAEYAEQARSYMQQARDARKEENPHTEAVKTAKAKIKDYNTEVIALTEREHEIATEAAHYAFWVKGFGGGGLPSFILDSVMPHLTHRANYYLEILSDGDIKVEFSTQKELKSSKELRDKIDISWEIEGMRGYNPSGGQFKKIEIAVDLALMDLVATREGAHPDILLLDEILDGLDAEGRNRVSHLLHELRKQRETIFVISHDDALASVFEKALVVNKKAGVSSLVTRGLA